MTHTADRGRSSWRMRVYPAALLATVAGVLIFASVVYDRDHPTSRLGGDYPAFYGAGRIVAEGDWDDLYSAERQQSEQAGLIDDEGGYLYFSYPPFVAGAYALVASVDYRWSFLVHTLLMGVAMFAAARLLWPWLEEHGWPTIAVVTVSLAFYPLLRSVTGGQNTALSVLLLAAGARLDRDQRPLAAGMVLAVLLFKPQYGVAMLLLMLVARRWEMVAGWIGGAAALYGLSAALTGGEWLADWWQQASAFRDLNAEANGVHFVSVPGFVENWLGSGAAVVAGYAVALVAAAAVALYWWRNPRREVLPRYALAAAGMALAAPQTLFYDAGLLAIGLVVMLGRPERAPVRRAPPLSAGAGLIVVWLLLSWTQVLSGRLGWSPLGPLAWAAAAMIWWGSAGPGRRPNRGSGPGNGVMTPA